MQGDVKKEKFEYYEQRFIHLRLISKDAEAGAWQYLLAVNGGGAAAMLAFIGAVPGYRSTGLSYAILGAFSVGLVLVGIALAHANVRIFRALNSWNSDMVLFMDDKLTWQEMHRRDHTRTGFTFVPWVCGYGALGLFIVGLIAAVWLFAQSVPMSRLGNLFDVSCVG